MGAERAYLFTMADEPNPNAGLFTSCGVLFGEAQGYAPKPSYTALAQIVSSLKGLRLSKDESTATARILRFDGGGNTAYVAWSPTSVGASFQAVVGGKARTISEAVQVFR